MIAIAFIARSLFCAPFGTIEQSDEGVLLVQSNANLSAPPSFGECFGAPVPDQQTMSTSPSFSTWADCAPEAHQTVTSSLDLLQLL